MRKAARTVLYAAVLILFASLPSQPKLYVSWPWDTWTGLAMVP